MLLPPAPTPPSALPMLDSKWSSAASLSESLLHLPITKKQLHQSLTTVDWDWTPCAVLDFPVMNSSSSSPARNSPNRGSKKSSFATGGSRFSISTMANGTDHFKSNKIKNNANTAASTAASDKNNSTTTSSNGVTTNDTSSSSTTSSSTPTQQQKNSGRIRRRSAPPVTLEGNNSSNPNVLFTLILALLISQLFFVKFYKIDILF